MSTSFWCSSCKKDHAGDCPPVPSPPDASFPNAPVRPGGGITAGKGLSFGGGNAPFVLGPPTPSMSPAEFDALVDLYGEMDVDQLTDHYRAAKEALLRRLGASPPAP